MDPCTYAGWDGLSTYVACCIKFELGSMRAMNDGLSEWPAKPPFQTNKYKSADFIAVRENGRTGGEEVEAAGEKEWGDHVR